MGAELKAYIDEQVEHAKTKARADRCCGCWSPPPCSVRVVEALVRGDIAITPRDTYMREYSATEEG